jgi:hypothetical protein
MLDNKKRCTEKLEKALSYVDEFIYGNNNINLAKQITTYVFSLNQISDKQSFSIKCYVTKIPDIRFCIDRGSDCLKARTMTNFLVLRPPCEIHVIDNGKPYLRPQDHTNFHIITTNNLLELNFDEIINHINNSFCSRIKQFSLQSALCE